MARLTLRLDFGPGRAIGHGKIWLLEAVRDHGSISAAGRSMGMSYRRAWLLVDALNRLFETPVVETKHGGSAGGGAELTPFGHQDKSPFAPNTSPPAVEGSHGLPVAWVHVQPALGSTHVWTRTPFLRRERNQARLFDSAAPAYSELPPKLECGADRSPAGSPLRRQGRRALARHSALGARALLRQRPQSRVLKHQ